MITILLLLSAVGRQVIQPVFMQRGAALKTLLIEGESSVSQITITDMIENYPGIPEGIGGFELMQLFKKQALKFGLEILSKDVTGIKIFRFARCGK